MKPSRVSTVKRKSNRTEETMYGKNFILKVQIEHFPNSSTPRYVLIEGCYTGPGNKNKVWKPLYSRTRPNIDLEHMKDFLKRMVNDDEPMEIFSYFEKEETN